MVTYMGNFVPHLSHHTEPLRQLLKKDIAFYWDDQLTLSFQEIKNLLEEKQLQSRLDTTIEGKKLLSRRMFLSEVWGLVSYRTANQ